MYSDLLDRRIAAPGFPSTRPASTAPGSSERHGSPGRYAARRRRGETLLGLGGTMLCYASLAAILLWRWTATPLTPSSPPAPTLAVFDVPPAAPPSPTVPHQSDTEPKPSPQRQEIALPNPTLPILERRDAVPVPPVAPIPSPPVDDAPKVASHPASKAAPANAAPTLVPPTSGSKAAAERAARANWQGDLLAHLRPLLRYPRIAQREGQQGVVLVAIGVARDGIVRSARIVRGSGYPLLDGEALATIRRGSPLPPPTPDIPGDPVAVELPIQFSLQG